MINNVFGAITSRFLILRTLIIPNREKLILIIKVLVALHNFMMKKSQSGN